jgi:hypothetical protein
MDATECDFAGNFVEFILSDLLLRRDMCQFFDTWEVSKCGKFGIVILFSIKNVHYYMALTLRKLQGKIVHS